MLNVPLQGDFRQSVVAIVGRPNVGKSSIFNALVGRRVAIVDAMPGTTRDRVSAVLTESGKIFEIHDTAGIAGSVHGELERNVQRQVEIALEIAKVVVYVIDASEGATPEDTRIAERLRKTGLKTVLVANKIDRSCAGWSVAEAYKLGLGEPLLTSAVHRRGTGELREAIAAQVPAPAAEAPSPFMRVAVVGRQNVGKSTLVNRLAMSERMVVSETPGTTRDAVEVPCRLKNGFFVAIDTAGIRKKGSEQTTAELWSRHRTAGALRTADVVLFLLDAAQKVSEVDKRIAAEIVELAIPCVICVNKWDLARSKYSPADYGAYIGRTLPALSFAPVSLISALDGTNAAKTIALARELVLQANTRVNTAQLNTVVRQVSERHSPQSTGAGLARIYYATQVGTAPVRITVFVNKPRNFSRRYLQFLKHELRRRLPFAEIPIILLLRGHSDR